MQREALGGEPAQREQLAAWEAALAASGLPVAGLDAVTPKPRFAIAAPLAGDIPGHGELVDLWLVERLPRWRVREALASALPPGHRLVDLYDVWLGEAPLPGRVTASVYRAVLGPPVDPARLAAAAASLMAADSLPRERRRGEATVRYDLRPFLVHLGVDAGPGESTTVEMTLRHDPERGVGRPDETLFALGEALGEGRLATDSLVRVGLVLAETPSPEPPAPKGRRPLPGRREEAPSAPAAARPTRGGQPRPR